MVIRLADSFIRWMPEYKDFVSGFEAENEQEDCILTLSAKQSGEEYHGVQFIETTQGHVIRRMESAYELLCANDDWSQAALYCKNYSDANFTLPLTAICSRLSFFNTLLIHGSFVKHNNSGIIFTGYSGVGKTTQAKLWNKYLDAEIINGDKVLIRSDDNGAVAYGLPWQGSSPYRLNKKAPVKAIIALRQAKENKISRLNSIECAQYFMPHIFLPHWDKSCLQSALDTFDSIIKDVPVYLLECRADEEAVILTENTVF